MQFVEVLFAVILMLAGAHGKAPEDQMRLHQVAADTWAEVESTPVESLPFVGEAAREATALALVAAADHESGYWSKVQDCSACFRGSQYCDKGLSITLYQLREGSGAWGKHTREELCADNRLATQQALKHLLRTRRAGTTLSLMRGYARGGRRQAGPEMDALFWTAARKAGVTIKGNMEAVWVSKPAGNRAQGLTLLPRLPLPQVLPYPPSPALPARAIWVQPIVPEGEWYFSAVEYRHTLIDEHAQERFDAWSRTAQHGRTDPDKDSAVP